MIGVFVDLFISMLEIAFMRVISGLPYSGANCVAKYRASCLSASVLVVSAFDVYFSAVLIIKSEKEIFISTSLLDSVVVLYFYSPFGNLIPEGLDLMPFILKVNSLK